MRIAMSGVRGVPARFGGSETAVEEIGRRLVERGHQVTVYCRAHNSTTQTRAYLGMRRVVLPSINTLNFDTVSHSLLSSIHLRLSGLADVIHYHGMGNALLLPLLFGSKQQSVITIDGPDWERPKWGPAARLALKTSARMASRFADRLIIDNHPAIAYFRKHFGVDGVYIPYGADTDIPASAEYLRQLSLRPREYVLFVAAMVPDKGPDIAIEAYKHVKTDMPLVMIGDSPFFPEFREKIYSEAAKDARIIMPGYVYGDHYRQLLTNAFIYLHPFRSDGTSPSLLQALAYCNCVVINSLPEALSAAGDAAVPYAQNDPRDLAQKIEYLIAHPEVVEEYRRRARQRVEAEYSWDRVTDAHEAVYRSVLSGVPAGA